MGRHNPNFIGWRGPNANIQQPCHICDGTGVIEGGERIDVDVYLDCLCGHCGGNGEEPRHAAGDRDTTAPRRDVLADYYITGFKYYRRRVSRSEYRRILSRFMRPVLIELSVCESFAKDRGNATHQISAMKEFNASFYRLFGVPA